MSPALHTNIADHLREQIRTGALVVGDSVPSESELCREWHASRGPVRQAIATLRSEGIIAGGQGKRAVVRTVALTQPFDTLLSFSAWARSIGRIPGQRTLELALRPAGPLAIMRLGVDATALVVEELRLRFLDGDRAMLERATYVEHVGRLLFDFDTDSGSEWEYLQTRGVHFAGASHVIDAVAADPEDALHLGVTEGAPLLRQQRVTRTTRGEAIEYHDDRYLPGMISFTLENTLDTRVALTRNVSC